MATHAHRVPLSTGYGTRVSVRGTLHVVEIVARDPAGYAQAGGEPQPCQVTRTRGSPGCGVSVTAVRRDAICRSNPVVTFRGREWKISSRSMRQRPLLGGREARRCVSLVVTRLSSRRPGVRFILREPSPLVEGKNVETHILPKEIVVIIFWI